MSESVHSSTYSIGVNFLFVQPIEYLVCFMFCSWCKYSSRKILIMVTTTFFLKNDLVLSLKCRSYVKTVDKLTLTSAAFEELREA